MARCEPSSTVKYQSQNTAGNENIEHICLDRKIINCPARQENQSPACRINKNCDAYKTQMFYLVKYGLLFYWVLLQLKIIYSNKVSEKHAKNLALSLPYLMKIAIKGPKNMLDNRTIVVWTFLLNGLLGMKKCQGNSTWEGTVFREGEI